MTGWLPCPWCGCAKEPTIRDGSTFRWRVVECAECGASPGEFRSDNRFDLTDADLEGVRSYWNRRKGTLKVTALICPQCGTAVSTRTAQRVEPVAWIASRKDREPLHFAKLDGWDVQPVMFKEP